MASTSESFYAEDHVTPQHASPPASAGAFARAKRLLLAPGDALALGPRYADWMWRMRSPEILDAEETWREVTTSAPGVLSTLARLYPTAPQHHVVRAMYRLQSAWRNHEEGIEHHYDVGDEFYKLFLDKKYMFYTCADFHSATDTIEQAQTNKAKFILGLLDPKPGEKILDLGSGWGALLRCIHEVTGDKANLVGYTLSKRQLAYVDALGFRNEYKNFVTCDYAPASFDKIVSVGTFESVRPHHVPMLYRKLAYALRPGGRMVHHFFYQREKLPPPHIGMLAHIFPGSLPTTLEAHLHAIEAAGLRVTHQSIHDYRQTLRAWFERLVANRDRALSLVGREVYNRYLIFFAGAWRMFNERDFYITRLVMIKR